MRFVALAASLALAGCGQLAAPTASTSTSRTADRCRADDLRLAAANFQGATGAIVGHVTVTSRAPCLVTGRPRVAIAEPNGRTLDVEIYPARPFIGGRAGKSGAVVGPGRPASFHVLWRNWCADERSGMRALDLLVALDAGAGHLRVPVRVIAPRCDARSAPSTLGVTPFAPSRPSRALS